MGIILKGIRFVLSWVLVTLDRLFPPRSLERLAEAQQKIDGQTAGWILYHFEGCPFCIKVRRKIRALGLRIENREVLTNENFMTELLTGGKDYQVPCLMIPGGTGANQWIYESTVINAFLDDRFGRSA